MKKIILTAFIILFASAFASASEAKAERNRHISDSLQQILARTTTARDSVPILYDLLDLSRYSDRAVAGERLLATARRGASRSVQFDIMRRLAAIYANGGSKVDRIIPLINEVAAMPQSPEQRTTLTFLRVERVAARVNSLPESDRQVYIQEMLRNRGVETADPYDRIEMLFMLCKYLQNNILSEQLSRYLDELGALLHEQPYQSKPLENLYYTQASLIYTVSGQHEKAIEACRKLLEIVNDLESEAIEKGYRYRNYDTMRYIILRRMLNNYQSLTDEEIEQTYDAIKQLTEQDPDVYNAFNSVQRPTIYYLMAKKRYPEALAIIKKQVNNPDNRIYLNHLYQYMIEAAEAVGDKDALLLALKESNRLMQNSLDLRASDRSRELDIIDDLTITRNHNIGLQKQQQQQERLFHQRTITLVSTGAGLLLVAIIILLILLARARKLSAKIKDTNETLTTERDNLRQMQKEILEARDHARKADQHKTEFVNNMSHEIRTPLNAIVECAHLIVDNVDESKQQYLKRYAKTIDVSADMLNAIVTDVLEIATSDNSEVLIQKKPASVNAIGNFVVESMRKHCKDGVEMTYVNANDPDTSITTDARRVEQVLINLLSNAAKFTDEGHIHLSYWLDPESTLTFAVEDTGCGIPAGKEEIIFNRFEKLSSLVPGTGLGLNICRTMAKRLGGTVRVDTSYTGPGARFLFTIPL